ncbi:MAG: ATP-binding protein [Pseudomonadota bacterium]|nr:hypothetical protein [Gammaproteobacteria bacterium]MEC8009223.1 ATP-binding protein [Pseudomonadota bacterium]HBF07978.1 hypothetical protein [Gammaproteobacteria bacterium]|tara:strand:+ start:16862 stop:18445 length:1584 start_codon:yes stop_codon:yes gene_type:complete
MTQHQDLFHFLKTPIKIYSSYRFLLSFIFVAIAVTHPTTSLSVLSPSLVISTLYFFIASSFLAASLFQIKPVVKHTFIGFIIDIISIALLEYTSLNKGVSLDLVLIVSVAAGSIVFIGPLGMGIAAIATIALCLKEFIFNDLFGVNEPSSLRTAILGITFFATAWIAQTLAKRLIESERITSKQARNIQQLENLNQAIIERMHTGIVVFDHDLNTELMNQAAQHLLSPDAANEIAPETGLALLQDKIEHWLQKDHIETQTIQLSSHAPELKIGFTYLTEEQRIVVFLEDNTKFKQHAQQLKLASLGRLAASIAHEIRNPLAAVSYASELLQETQLAEDQTKLVNILERHVKRMNEIVENVLQLSRREPPQLQTITLNDWLNEFRNAVFPQVNFITIHNENETALDVEFDPSHLSQVCTNLIENALNAIRPIMSKDSAFQPQITLSVGFIHALSRVFLNITDNGPGIPNDKLAHIFDPFFTTSKSGSGLGLFLCREICELNHARVHTLPVEQGTCFQILFKPRNINGE